MEQGTGTVKLYYPESVKHVNYKDAMTELRRIGQFQVFLSFVDPRTDLLVEGNFTFYPKVQASDHGLCFIAEHQGLTLRIPADMYWWSKREKTDTLGQKTAILVEGEYVTTKFDLDVGRAIRVEPE